MYCIHYKYIYLLCCIHVRIHVVPLILLLKMKPFSDVHDHTGSKIFVLKYLVFPPGIEMKCQINFAPNNNSCLFCSNFRMSQLWGCVYQKILLFLLEYFDIIRHKHTPQSRHLGHCSKSKQMATKSIKLKAKV